MQKDISMFEEDDDEEMRDPRSLPIYKKGEEIYDLTRQVADLIPDDNEMLESTKGFMLEDASMICAKIAGAEGGDIYDIRMECAAIIRKSARDLSLHVHSLRTFGFKEVHYYQLIRDAIEEFRLLFIDWVDSFDTGNYYIDRWGLFNPPGVGPFDKDPDEDIPFDPSDYFEMGDDDDDDDD